MKCWRLIRMLSAGRQRARNKSGPLEVWAKDLADGSKAVGLFNRSDETATVQAPYAALGLQGSHRVRDLWRQQDLGSYPDCFAAPVPRHGVVLVRVFDAIPRKFGAKRRPKHLSTIARLA